MNYMRNIFSILRTTPKLHHKNFPFPKRSLMLSAVGSERDEFFVHGNLRCTEML